MRVERIGKDKIKIFLTYDDLQDRGINKEDLWTDVPRVHDLFNDIMEEAYEQVGFELVGPIAVEVFALPAQGMVVIVTRSNSGTSENQEDEDDDSIFDFEVTLEQSDSIIFAFKDFENLISAVFRVNKYLFCGGQIYHYKNHYILVLDQQDVLEKETEKLIALLSEYGEASPVSKVMLEEYGKVIIDEDATKVIVSQFS